MPVPTVLVLGAGASFDYGYPTGAGLRDLILDLPDAALESLQPDGPIVRGSLFSTGSKTRGAARSTGSLNSNGAS